MASERTVELLLRARNMVSGPVAAARASLKTLWDSTAGGASRAIDWLFNLRNAMLAVAAAAAIRMVLRPAMEDETFRGQLKSMMGGMAQAEARMRDLDDFAKSTPFSLPGIVKANITLQTLTRGALANRAGLTLVGDAAARVNQPIEEMAVHFGRLYDSMMSGRPAGEVWMRLQELGLVTGDVRAKFEEMQKLGIKGPGVWAMFAKELDGLSGSMAELAGTTGGLISTLGDEWNGVLKDIGQELLPLVRGEITDLIAEINELRQSGKLKEYGQEAAAAIKTILDTLKALASWIDANRDTLSSLGMTAATVIGFVKVKEAIGAASLALAHYKEAAAGASMATTAANLVFGGGKGKVAAGAAISAGAGAAGAGAVGGAGAAGTGAATAGATTALGVASGLLLAAVVFVAGAYLGKAIGSAAGGEGASTVIGEWLAGQDGVNLGKDGLSTEAPANEQQASRIAAARAGREAEQEKATRAKEDADDAKWLAELAEEARVRVERQAALEKAALEAKVKADKELLDGLRKEMDARVDAQQELQQEELAGLREVNQAKEEAADAEREAMREHVRGLREALPGLEQAARDAKAEAKQVIDDRLDPAAAKERRAGEQARVDAEAALRRRAAEALQRERDGGQMTRGGRQAIEDVAKLDKAQEAQAALDRAKGAVAVAEREMAAREKELQAERAKLQAGEKELQAEHKRILAAWAATLVPARDPKLAAQDDDQVKKAVQEARRRVDEGQAAVKAAEAQAGKIQVPALPGTSGQALSIGPVIGPGRLPGAPAGTGEQAGGPAIEQQLRDALKAELAPVLQEIAQNTDRHWTGA